MSSAIGVNFKIFYQRRTLYFWYLIILSQFPVMFSMSRVGALNLRLMLIPIIFGFLVGGICKDVMSRPLTYCLPKFSRIPRRLIFGVGVFVSGLISFVSLNLAIDSVGFDVLVFIAWFMLSLSIFLCGAQTAYSEIGNWMAKVPLFLMGLLIFHRSELVLNFIFSHGLVVSFAAMLYCIYCWGYFGSQKHHRRFFSGIGVVMFDCFNLDRSKTAQMSKVLDKISKRGDSVSFLERFMLGRSLVAGQFTRRRSSWAMVYSIVDNIMIRGLVQLVLPMICVMLFYGYLFGIEIGNGVFMKFINFFYVIPVFGAIMWKFPPHEALHVPVSRKDKFVASIYGAVGITAATMVFVGLIALLGNVIAPYMPELPEGVVGSLSSKFMAPDLSMLILTPALMPLAFAISVVVRKKAIVRTFFGPLMMLIAMGFSFAGVAVSIRWSLLIVVLLLFWCIYAGVLYRYCMKKDLVSAG